MHSQHQPHIAVIGDINADISFVLPAFPHEGEDTQIDRLSWGSGGSGLNIAIALAHLGANARMLGRVGSDPAAEVALRAARRARVDLSHLQTDPQVATGLCGVMVSPGGERSFLSFRGANPRYGPEAIDRDTLRGCALLVVSGYALLEDPQRAATMRAIGIATELAIPCALDLCLPAVTTARSQIINELLPQLWLLTMNAAELRALLPGLPVSLALDRLLQAGAGTVAIKRGAQGCSVAQGSTRVAVLPPAVAVTDTNACGDAFTAGFAWALLHYGSLAECAALGNLMGALTATQPGAADAIPERQEILARAAPEIRHLIDG